MAVDELSRTFAALADPTRRAILNQLADLVTKSRDGQRRPCHAEPIPLDPAIDWLEQHRQGWEDRLDRLGDHLRRLQTKENP